MTEPTQATEAQLPPEPTTPVEKHHHNLILALLERIEELEKKIVNFVEGKDKVDAKAENPPAGEAAAEPAPEAQPEEKAPSAAPEGQQQAV